MNINVLLLLESLEVGSSLVFLLNNNVSSLSLASHDLLSKLFDLFFILLLLETQVPGALLVGNEDDFFLFLDVVLSILTFFELALLSAVESSLLVIVICQFLERGKSGEVTFSYLSSLQRYEFIMD